MKYFKVEKGINLITGFKDKLRQNPIEYGRVHSVPPKTRDRRCG